ncbi:LysR family transcriptional regulator [Nonomuraea turkmeniaca]|uniref:LysR family transcriptional regulator n=1 Tax=Nonomuraea turkmeniaca TaxID=103838 RepID=A0A5S4EUJ8_9ACTN|nr:LysR family transcriptional regulator [Nonomuraea turkmeniaca]TMR02193.1 LysR family transcriptional regulator [Nonomuraea turkmeniaca]
MELRQLRYFVTLAEELHFGRAAAREHIVQSALSQQIQRLERELGVVLLERSTHHVSLTASGTVLLAEARQILAHVERATTAARNAMGSSPTLRVGIIDSGYDSMPQILHEAQARQPDLVIHQIEVGVPEQYRLLIDGRLDVGIGRAALAPPEVASLLFRRDPLGVLVPGDHPFAELDVRAAADLVSQGRCLYCVPSSCISALPGIMWRPLVEPVSTYPWSILWRAGDESRHVRTAVNSARTMSERLGWLTGRDQTTR